MTERDRLLAACVRATTFYTPLIKRAATKAAHGLEQGAQHQLSEAIRYASDLLKELRAAQSLLGWCDRDGEVA